MKVYLRLLVLLGIVVMTGCRKDSLSNLSPEEQRIYITNYDKAANFTNYRTFSIANNVVVVDNNNSRQQSTLADQALIQAISRGLQSRGFSAASSNNTADFGVQVSRIVRTSTGFVSGPDYWGYWDPGFWGYGGFGPGWGNGFGSGWSVIPYEVKEGMLAIDIIDLKNNSGSLKVLWNAMVRGPGLNDPSSVNDIVDNLLKQSPYLQTN